MKCIVSDWKGSGGTGSCYDEDGSVIGLVVDYGYFNRESIDLDMVSGMITKIVRLPSWGIAKCKVVLDVVI